MSVPASAVLQIQNLFVNAASWTAGQDMTVIFDVQSTSGGTIKFSIGITDEVPAQVTTNVKKIQWLADEKGIYKNQTSYTYYNGVTNTGISVGMPTTDVQGSNGGISVGLVSSVGWTTVTVVTHIPPEMTGSGWNVVVALADSALNPNVVVTCNSGLLVNKWSSVISLPTIAGTNPMKYDLEFCNPGQQVDKEVITWRIVNYGESGVYLNRFKWKAWYYDTVTGWSSQVDCINTHDSAGGAGTCAANINSATYSYRTFTTQTDCGSGRSYNQEYTFDMTTLTPNYSASNQDPVFIPPGGGYVSRCSPTELRRGAGGINLADDYSRITDAPACAGQPTTDLPQFGLYYNNGLVCEWDDAATRDLQTGIEPCGLNGACCTAGGAQTLYMDLASSNRQYGSTKYYDLDTVVNAGGMVGEWGQPQPTLYTYPAMASGPVFSNDCVLKPLVPGAMPNTALGGAPSGFGFMSTFPLSGDLVAGNWTFSGDYMQQWGAVAGSLAVYQEAQVYLWDPVTNTNQFLFTATSPTNLYPGGASFTNFTASFTVAEPAFANSAGKYVKVEPMMRFTGQNVAGGNFYMGFNTANDYVSFPGTNCPVVGTPTPTASPSPTSTPTPSMPLLKTVNVSAAILGDTVTFCINWINNSNSTVAIPVWDTISSYVTYMGCISGCAHVGSLVSWTTAAMAPGTTGTFCWWGTLNGFPWLPMPGVTVEAALPRRHLIPLYFPLESSF